MKKLLVKLIKIQTRQLTQQVVNTKNITVICKINNLQILKNKINLKNGRYKILSKEKYQMLEIQNIILNIQVW